MLLWSRGKMDTNSQYWFVICNIVIFWMQSPIFDYLIFYYFLLLASLASVHDRMFAVGKVHGKSVRGISTLWDHHACMRKMGPCARYLRLASSAWITPDLVFTSTMWYSMGTAGSRSLYTRVRLLPSSFLRI